METGTTTIYDGALLAAVTNGTVPETLVDQACLRILTTMFRLGVFDTAYTPSRDPGSCARRSRPPDRGAGHHAAEEQRQPAAADLRDASRSPSSARTPTSSPSPSGAPWVSPTKTTSVLNGILARAGVGERELGARQRPGQRGVDAGEQRHDHRAVLGAHADQRRRHRADAFYWHNTSFQGAPAVTRVDKQVNYDVGFLSTFGSWAGQTSQVPIPPVNSPAEQQSVVYDGIDHRAQDRRLHPCPDRLRRRHPRARRRNRSSP